MSTAIIIVAALAVAGIGVGLFVRGRKARG